MQCVHHDHLRERQVKNPVGRGWHLSWPPWLLVYRNGTRGKVPIRDGNEREEVGKHYLTMSLNRSFMDERRKLVWIKLQGLWMPHSGLRMCSVTSEKLLKGFKQRKDQIKDIRWVANWKIWVWKLEGWEASRETSCTSNRELAVCGEQREWCERHLRRKFLSACFKMS